jgi:hypothetical protein
MHRRLFLASCILSTSSIGIGCFIAGVWYGFDYRWLTRVELCGFMLLALVYGFAGGLPSCGELLWSRPVRGAAMVTCGVAAVFVPVGFVIAALLVGTGTRLVWLTAVDNHESETPAADVYDVIDDAPDGVGVGRGFESIDRRPDGRNRALRDLQRGRLENGRS